MPTPACLATAVIGASGSLTNTARADSSIRWSLRAASAWRPLIGPCRWRPRLGSGAGTCVLMNLSIARTGINHSVLLRLEQKDLFRSRNGEPDGIRTKRRGWEHGRGHGHRG